MLIGRGLDVRVADLTGTLAGGPPYGPRQVDVIAACADGQPTILVGHSGAGALLAPAGLAADYVLGYVFVDAGLPIPGRSQMSTMPPELASQLHEMTGPDGWLPPWPQWWGEDTLAELIPDAGTRQRFAAECPRLPLALFTEIHPEGRDLPGAYVRLSDGYDEPFAQATKNGWPVVELPSHHLAPLTDPGLVTDAILTMVSQLQ